MIDLIINAVIFGAGYGVAKLGASGALSKVLETLSKVGKK